MQHGRCELFRLMINQVNGLYHCIFNGRIDDYYRYQTAQLANYCYNLQLWIAEMNCFNKQKINMARTSNTYSSLVSRPGREIISLVRVIRSIRNAGWCMAKFSLPFTQIYDNKLIELISESYWDLLRSIEYCHRHAVLQEFDQSLEIIIFAWTNNDTIFCIIYKHATTIKHVKQAERLHHLFYYNHKAPIFVGRTDQLHRPQYLNLTYLSGTPTNDRQNRPRRNMNPYR